MMLPFVVLVVMVIYGIIQGDPSLNQEEQRKPPLIAATELVEYVIINEADILDLANGWTEEDVIKFRKDIYWDTEFALSDLKGEKYVVKPEFNNTHLLNATIFSHGMYIEEYQKTTRGNVIFRNTLSNVRRKKVQEAIRLSIAEIRREGGNSTLFDVWENRVRYDP